MGAADDAGEPTRLRFVWAVGDGVVVDVLRWPWAASLSRNSTKRFEKDCERKECEGQYMI